MSALDTRHTPRDSMFMVAKLQTGTNAEPFDVRIRNLSATGMMVQSPMPIEAGTSVTVALRNLADIAGVVAWCEGERIGIAFDEDIDPLQVRANHAPASNAVPAYARGIPRTDPTPATGTRYRPV